MEPIENQLNDFLEDREKTKGKNFSRNRPRPDRIGGDFYQTPHCLTRSIIDCHIKASWEPDGNAICDFCSGDNAIVKVLNNNGYNVIHSDIKYNEQFPYYQDFFAISKIRGYGIMNPPFRLFNKRVEHCFEVFGRSFALLAPTTYLQGVKRYNKRYQDGIFQNPKYPLTHVYTFNRYPMLSAELRPDGLIETGMQALSWFVWTRLDEDIGTFKYSGDTVHRWIDIDSFVLRKGRKRI
jgi:hypothetical protein